MKMLVMKMLVVASTDDGDDYKYNDTVKTHSMTIDQIDGIGGIEPTYNIFLVCGKVLMFLV